MIWWLPVITCILGGLIGSFTTFYSLKRQFNFDRSKKQAEVVSRYLEILHNSWKKFKIFKKNVVDLEKQNIVNDYSNSLRKQFLKGLLEVRDANEFYENNSVYITRDARLQCELLVKLINQEICFRFQDEIKDFTIDYLVQELNRIEPIIEEMKTNLKWQIKSDMEMNVGPKLKPKRYAPIEKDDFQKI